MAGDKTYVTDNNDKLHRATRTKGVTPSDIVWSSNPNDYTVQVLVDGKWHRAVLTYDVQAASFFDNINIDKALIVGDDGKSHTALIIDPTSSDVNMSPIPTDDHSTLAGTTTGETALNVYSEEWASVQWQDNVNVYKVLVQGSDGKTHTALLTTSVIGEVEVIVKGTSPLEILDAIADSLIYLKAFGGVEQRNVPEGYQELAYIEGHNNAQYINTGIVPTSSMSIYFKGQFVSVDSSTPNQVSFLAGARDVGGQYGFFLQLAATNVGLDWFVVNGRWTENHTRAVGDVVEMKVSSSLAEIWVNGTSVGTHQYTPNDTTQYPLFLNGLNSVGQPFDTNVNVVNRIYRFTINGICDMRPARRLSDGVLGMYDTIRKRFFTNAGTGSFVAGRDISAESLPTGYTRLAYIESNGTQYIDTGLKVDQNTEIETVFQRTQLSNYFIYGISTSGNIDTCSAYVTGTAGAHYWRFDDEFVNMQDVGGVIDTIWHRTIQNKNGVKLDSNPILAYTSIGTFETVGGLPIFCRYVTASSEYSGFAYIRISSFVMRKNGTDILNLVPAKRNSDGAIGMYDTVSNTFFANAGTGTFAYAEYPTPTAPQDIWCNNGAIKAIRPIKYLESTGTQYIDTGVVPNQDTRVELDGQMISTTAAAFFGVRTDATTDVYAIQRHSSGKIAMGYNDLFGLTDVDADTNRHVWYKNKNLQYIDGNLAFTANYSNFTAMGTAILFGFNNNGSKASSASLRVYSCKIWDGDTLVRDFIPALDANNIPCMFDKVEGKCYYNAGTGQFIAPYLPADYEELEYIQGYTGNSSVDPSIKAAYIDTGIVFDTTLNMYYKGGVGGFNTNSVLAFGARPNNAYSGISSYFSGADVVTDWGGTDASGRWTLPLTLIAGDTFEVSTYNKTMTISKNGVVAGTNTFTGTATNGLSFYLNSRHDTNGAPSQSSPSIGRLYRFTVAGVCDMIPARKRSNGHIGMYDLVRRQFFESAGEGQFTFGKLPILPDGYTQLEYLESTGTQYIDTGVKPNQDTSVELDGSIDGYGIFFGVRTAALVDISTIQGTSTGFWAMGYNTSADAFGSKDSNRHVWFKNKNLQYMDGDLKQNYTYANFTAMGNAYLFAYNNNGTVGYVINGTVRIYSCKIWATADSMLVRHLIPAKRNSDSVVGMYDIMNDVFLTNQGTGDFEYGSEIPDSRESYYYVDGVVETIATKAGGSTLSTATCENLLGIGSIQDIQEILIGEVTRKVGVLVLNGSETWIDFNNQHQMYQMPIPDTTAPTVATNIVCSHFVSDLGSLANMPNNSGKVSAANTFPNSAVLMIKKTDIGGLSQWMSFLRSQYDAGTPVIVVYQLSEDKTESVAGQALTVSAGNNTAEIIQASIDDLELEAKYMKVA